MYQELNSISPDPYTMCMDLYSSNLEPDYMNKEPNPISKDLCTLYMDLYSFEIDLLTS